MSIKQFLDSVANSNTRKSYRRGLTLFIEWYGKTAEKTLLDRKDDLTQRPGEDLIDFKNRAARFERRIEKFHSWMKNNGYSINSARTNTLGIMQLFRYYHMSIQKRRGSSISQTTKTTRSYPLTIEHVRAMFKVANLKERVVLSMATDLGLRISDFVKVKREDLPDLSQEAPLLFETRTRKEKVVAEGFLSSETVELLKTYLKTLERRDNAHLFAGNRHAHITEEGVNKMLRILAEKAQINTNNKRLTFHCFRKMFLSTAVDVGLLTAGKIMCGKSIVQSDDTYFTTVKLKQAFQKIKAQLTIQERLKPENHERLEQMQSTIVNQQTEIQDLKTRIDALTQSHEKQNTELEKMKKNQEVVDHVLEQLDLSVEDAKILSEKIQEWREQRMREEEAEIYEREQKENAEILEKLRKERKI